MLASPQFLIGLLHIKPTQLLLNRESTGAFNGNMGLDEADGACEFIEDGVTHWVFRTR
jgi:hypothetical protein